MGVRNLWKILSVCGKRGSFEDKRLAIDTSIWMHQFKSMNDTAIVFSISKRIFRILYHRIKPVFVFDGEAHPLKKATLEKRREDSLRQLLRKIIMNKKCGECGELLKNCSHINDFDEKKLESLNKEAYEKLRNHDYDWGEHSSDWDSSESSESGNQNEKTHRTESHFHDMSISNFNYEDIQSLSKQEQLERLIDLRSKRKLPMHLDERTPQSFSVSQIENVKKRNKITSTIRDLNKSTKRVIQSDWTSYSEFRKTENEAEVYKTFCFLQEEREIIEPESESSDLERLFDKYQPVTVKTTTHKKEQKNVSCDIDEIIERNLLIVKNIPETKKNDDLFKNITEERALIETKSEMVIQQQSNLECLLIDKEGSSESREPSQSDCSFQILYEEDLFSSEEPHEVTQNCTVKTSSTGIQRIQKVITEVLDAFNLPHIQSIGESDAQCGYLFQKNLVDGVITEDNDMIIHGATVYKNFFRKDKDILCFTCEDIYKELGLDKECLIRIAFLLGSDYCPGVKGIGIKTVVDKMNTVTGREIEELRKIYNDTAVNKVTEISFGTMNPAKMRRFFIEKGLDQEKIDELMLYYKKVKEMAEE